MPRIDGYFARLDPEGQTAPVAINDPRVGAYWYGGPHKAFEADLRVGAYNHFDLPAFVAFLAALNWNTTDVVQVIVKEQDDRGFRVIDIVPEPEPTEWAERPPIRTPIAASTASLIAPPVGRGRLKPAMIGPVQEGEEVTSEILVGSWTVVGTKLFRGYDLSLITFFAEGIALATTVDGVTWHGVWRPDDAGFAIGLRPPNPTIRRPKYLGAGIWHARLVGDEIHRQGRALLKRVALLS